MTIQQAVIVGLRTLAGTECRVSDGTLFARQGQDLDSAQRQRLRDLGWEVRDGGWWGLRV